MQNWRKSQRVILQCHHIARGEPEVIKAFSALNQSVHKSRYLESKNLELIASAVAVTTRCDGCIASHASSALNAGAIKEEAPEVPVLINE